MELPTEVPPISSFRSRAFALGLSVALIWVLVSAWVHRGHFVDDAFISLRYAGNLLGGEGLVFNPGEVVEGVTNVGWVLVVAGVGWVVPGALPLVAKGLGLGFLVVAVGLVAVAYRRLVPSASPLELALVPILVVSSPELVYFSLAGMETGLAALLVVLGAWCVVPERPRVVAAAVCCAGLFLVRPEGVLVFPLFAAAMLVAGGRAVSRRRMGVALALFLALVLAVTVARWGYYGEVLPNTFWAKGAGGVGVLLRRGWEALVGRNVNLPAPFVGSLLLVLGGLGTASLRHRSRAAAVFLASAVGAGLLFAVYAPPDWSGMGRYFGPYVPAAAVLVVRGLFSGLARVPRLRSPSATGAAAAVVLLFAGIGLWRGEHHLGARALGEYPGFVLSSETLVPPARWIGRELPVGARIAARRIGALAYFGRRPVFDYAFGLTDRRVARAAAASGEGFESPDDPRLAGLWRAARPDCLLEDEEVTAPLTARWRGTGPLEVHGLRYEPVRSFELGAGAARWVLACRPGIIAPGAR